MYGTGQSEIDSFTNTQSHAGGTVNGIQSLFFLTGFVLTITNHVQGAYTRHYRHSHGPK